MSSHDVVMSSSLAADNERHDRTPIDQRLFSITALGVLLSSAIICITALRAVQLADVRDLGLIQALPPYFWLGLASLALAFIIVVTRSSSPEWLSAALVIGLIVILYGSTSFVTEIPRGAVAWRHAGITSNLIESGHPDPRIDAYFSWPAFFALAAFTSEFAGLASPLALAPWAPLAVNLITLGPLLLLMRQLSADKRLVWLALWLFYCTNWINQDYFAPQSFAFVLYVIALACLLKWFHPQKRTEPRRMAKLYLVVVFLCFSMIPAHQLTPFALLTAVTGLVLVRRCIVRGLPLVLLVAITGWVFFGARAYVAGHFDSLFGSIGNVAAVTSQNLTDRVQGSAGHLFAARTRIALSGLMWIGATVGFILRWKAGRRDVECVVLGLAPFILVALQPYGGEVLLRVFWLTLPFVSFFVAALLVPSTSMPWAPVRAWRMVLVSGVLLPLFMIARSGNDQLDLFRRGEVNAVQRMYALAPRGSLLVAPANNTPWRYRGYDEYQHDTMTAMWARQHNLNDIVQHMTDEGRAGGAHALFTRSGEASVNVLGGSPPRLFQNIRSRLEETPGWSVAYRNLHAELWSFLPRGAR